MTDDEFQMFPLLQKRLAKRSGRKPTCPYCSQILGIGQMVVQRKVWLPTYPKGEQLHLTWFHELCWMERDAQQKMNEHFLKHEAYEKCRTVSFKTLTEKLFLTQKPRPNSVEIPPPEGMP